MERGEKKEGRTTTILQSRVGYGHFISCALTINGAASIAVVVRLSWMERKERASTHLAHRGTKTNSEMEGEGGLQSYQISGKKPKSP